MRQCRRLHMAQHLALPSAMLPTSTIPSYSTSTTKFPPLWSSHNATGTAASLKSGLPVCADAVLAAVAQIAMAFTNMGAPDPRYNSFGKLDRRLTNLHTTWAKLDPAPTRVKFIPLQLLLHAHAAATASNSSCTLCHHRHGLACILFPSPAWRVLRIPQFTPLPTRQPPLLHWQTASSCHTPALWTPSSRQPCAP